MGSWYQKQDMNHKQILLVFIHTKTNIQENMISYESLIHHVCHNHQKWCVRISNSSLLSWSSEVICIQLTNTVLQSSKGTLTFINSLWPNVFIWRHRTGSILSQEMPWCLMAPSHYLNHCWVSISDVLWHLLQDSFTWNYQDIYPWLKFTPPRGQSVKVWSCKTINVPRITWLVPAVVLQYPPPGSHRWPPVLCNDHLIFQSSRQPVHPHHGQYILEVIYPHLKAPARSPPPPPPPPQTHTHTQHGHVGRCCSAWYSTWLLNTWFLCRATISRLIFMTLWSQFVVICGIREALHQCHARVEPALQRTACLAVQWLKCIDDRCEQHWCGRLICLNEVMHGIHSLAVIVEGWIRFEASMRYNNFLAWFGWDVQQLSHAQDHHSHHWVQCSLPHHEPPCPAPLPYNQKAPYLHLCVCVLGGGGGGGGGSAWGKRVALGHCDRLHQLIYPLWSFWLEQLFAKRDEFHINKFEQSVGHKVVLRPIKIICQEILLQTRPTSTVRL